MIKARVGQTWKCSVSGGGYNESDLITLGSPGETDPLYFRVLPIGYDPKYLKQWISQFYLNSSFEFQPQNDLEWLALQLDKWYFAGNYIYKGNNMPMQSSVIGKGFSNVYTREQWQNMRYHLGLDEKPHCKLIGGEWVRQ